MLKRWIGLVALGGLLWVFSSQLGFAQGFRWPEEPENLSVLPADVRGRALGGVMRDFAQALGVRCQHCHAAREGQTLDPNDLLTFDFASDTNPKKDAARTMMRMVRAINEKHLKELDVADSVRIEVTCNTCHRGVERPQPLGDVLADVLEEEGPGAAVEAYHDLRKRYYGSAAYDFRPGILSRLGEGLVREGRPEAAIRILALENEQNPDFAYGHYVRATAHGKAGEQDAALEHLREAVELAPAAQKPFFRRKLEELEREQ